MAPKRMKYVSLIILTIHSSMLGISLRYARTKPGDMFLSSTAVVMTELVKLIICLFVVFWEEGKSVRRMKKMLLLRIIGQPWDTLKVCIPSLLYIIQNNLLYMAASNLEAAVYQVTYQLKILTTAVASVLVLKKKLILTQWFALVILLIGVVCAQLADESPSATLGENRLSGFLAALGASTLSGYAGIFLEKILKGSDISVWVRNVQLSALSLPLGLLTTLSDFSAIKTNGFFYGYDSFVIYVIFLQAAGGLIVAMVLKYADNILKSFATALAIIISCAASVHFFNFPINFQFVLGICLVILSIYTYNYEPPYRKKITV